MTSPQPADASNGEETLRQLLRDRIAQLESREENPPKSADEQAADDEFHVASTAARALVADREISAEEKLRVLQLMYTDCISNVRALEYDLGLEEKRLSVADLDYSELGEDLRKIEGSAEKLKSLSRELSKQNKAMLEDSAKRSAEERQKREEICQKFDEAMKDINTKLSQGETGEGEKDEISDELEAKLEQLQAVYDKRETFYQKSVNEKTEEEKQYVDKLKCAEAGFERDELKLITERRKLVDLRKRSMHILAEVDKIREHRDELMEARKTREANEARQGVDLQRLQQSVADLQKAMSKFHDETEELKAKSKDTIAQVKSLEEELDFWQTKSKSELDKRKTLEQLCRTLTEERTIMRKEVQAMKQAWRMLENEIENLRMEINEAETS